MSSIKELVPAAHSFVDGNLASYALCRAGKVIHPYGSFLETFIRFSVGRLQAARRSRAARLFDGGVWRPSFRRPLDHFSRQRHLVSKKLTSRHSFSSSYVLWQDIQTALHADQ